MQFTLGLRDELVVDNFAGGGGASTGIEAGIGRPVDIAINHDPVALAVHRMNHPESEHHTSDVWDIHPHKVTHGQPIGLAWFSPDCKHFSKAKGGKPVSKKIRGLAWVVVRWAASVKPRVIMLENVEEFQDWGPLDKATNMPCTKRRGQTFKSWVTQLRNLGYNIEWKQLRGCDYGAPTIRKRLFVIARRDGRPIVWPKPSHGAGLKPFRTAAECIDWSIPCPSIFGRKKPLAEKTLRRIAHGVVRYVIEAEQPFIIPVTHAGGYNRGHGLDEPFNTVTAAPRGEMALISPTFVSTRNGERKGQAPRVRGPQEPFWTVTAAGSQQAVCAAFLKHYGGVVGQEAEKPLGTITASDSNALMTASIVGVGGRMGQSPPRSVESPYHTVTTKNDSALVSAFLLKYYGTDQDPRLDQSMHTITTKARMGLITVNIQGEPYVITDIGMRMLQPRELFRAQGFPEDYVIDGLRDDGKPITKTEQVRLCGNSVNPQIAEALVRANFQHEALIERSAA